jgi:hypothetical protein
LSCDSIGIGIGVIMISVAARCDANTANTYKVAKAEKIVINE